MNPLCVHKNTALSYKHWSKTACSFNVHNCFKSSNVKRRTFTWNVTNIKYLAYNQMDNDKAVKLMASHCLSLRKRLLLLQFSLPPIVCRSRPDYSMLAISQQSFIFKCNLRNKSNLINFNFKEKIIWKTMSYKTVSCLFLIITTMLFVAFKLKWFHHSET